MKENAQSNWNRKARDGTSSSGSKGKSKFDVPFFNDPKDVTFSHSGEKRNWKRHCQKYLQELKDGKVKPSRSLLGIYNIQINIIPLANSSVLDTGCVFTYAQICRV